MCDNIDGRWSLTNCHIMLYRVQNVPTPQSGLEVTTLEMIGTDSVDGCVSNYHTIITTATAALQHVTILLLLHL